MSNPTSTAIKNDVDVIRRVDQFITKLTGDVGREAAYPCMINFLRSLDETSNTSLSFEKHAIVTAQMLVERLGIVPTHYTLHGVKSSGTIEASGGIADIYKGYIQDMLVCVKTPRLSQNMDAEQVRKNVANEGILWSRLRHPNILPFYGIYYNGKMSSLVSYWTENRDLASFLKKQPDANGVLLLHDIALGLHYLHERSIVHGDIKAENILVNDSGRACISDFGFSSILSSSGGTARWQAPELFSEDEAADGVACNTKATDIYAFACLAYEIFSGQPPFAETTNLARVICRVIQGHRPMRPALSSSWNTRGLTENVWALMEVCWDMNPINRPTVDGVVGHLEKALPEDTREGNGDFLRSTDEVREMLRRSATDVDPSVETFKDLLTDWEKVFENEFCC